MSALLGRTVLCALTVVLCLLGASKPAGNLKFQRVLATVPMIGSGTYDDPKRPMFCPSPREMAELAEAGTKPWLISYRFEPGDDGQTAIVELTAPDRESLSAILQSTDARVTVYEPNKISPDNLRHALQKVKAGFDLERFHGGYPAGQAPTAVTQ